MAPRLLGAMSATLSSVRRGIHYVHKYWLDAFVTVVALYDLMLVVTEAWTSVGEHFRLSDISPLTYQVVVSINLIVLVGYWAEKADRRWSNRK